MTNIQNDIEGRAKAAMDAGPLQPIRALSRAGLKSEWAYLGGFASIALSLGSWLVSRGKKDDKAQSDRWGIFIGHWAPTFFALGIALKHEETDSQR
ncbi:hypothetical protein BH11ACT3_BH11ACT3_08210 [soil metagenome]